MSLIDKIGDLVSQLEQKAQDAKKSLKGKSLSIITPIILNHLPNKFNGKKLSDFGRLEDIEIDINNKVINTYIMLKGKAIY